MIRFALPIVASLLFCAPAFGQNNWLLTTADFKSESVALLGLDPSGVGIAPAAGGEKRLVPMDQFLELTRQLPTAPVPGKYVLHMTGGDQLGGEPVALKADSLVWKNATVGQIDIPTSRLVAITPPGKPAPAERGHEDVVSLSNGDSVRGIIASMAGDKIVVQAGAGNSEVPMASVSAVAFAATPGGAGAQRGFRVRLDDGSSLIGPQARLEGDNLVLTLGKNADRKLALAHVAAIEQVNGPVSWLSARTPSEAIYYPFIGPPRTPAAGMDRTLQGGPIQCLDQRFARGINVHALSRLSWPLDGTFEAFRTRFAIADEGDGNPSLADAIVRIKLDDKVVFEQRHVRAGALSPVVALDLGGAKKLTLEVDGGAAYPQDAVNWIEPALLRHKPAPASTQPAADAPAQ